MNPEASDVTRGGLAAQKKLQQEQKDLLTPIRPHFPDSAQRCDTSLKSAADCSESSSGFSTEVSEDSGYRRAELAALSALS